MSTSRTRIRRYLLLCFLAVGILLASGAIAGSADSHVTLTVEDSTAVPTETINFEGDSYEIDAIATRDQGDELTAHVTLPDKVFTDVSFLLYNSDQQIEASRGVNRPGTDETVTFETDSVAPGTYMLNVELEGATEQMQPVVIEGYDISVDHTTEATRDDDLEVSAGVTPTALSTPPAAVEVVVWNETHSQRFEMSNSGDETYTSSVPLDQFGTGEYTVNVAALGDETFRGQQEVLALESSSLTIQETTSDDGTNDSDSGDDGGSNSDESTTDGDDDSTTDGDSDDSTGDDENNGNSSTDGTSSDEDTSSDSESSSSDDGSPSETDNATDDDVNGSETNGSDGSGTTDTNESDDDVISPNQNTSDEDTDDQASLFAVQGSSCSSSLLSVFAV